MDENKNPSSLNRYLIVGLIILVILGIFLVTVIFNTLKSQQKKAQSEPTPAIDNWQTYSSTQYGQTVTFKYPEEYLIEKGGKPFNLNEEGTSVALDIRCGNKDLCQKFQTNSLTINIYENRQNWNLDDWINNSINRPQAKCIKKDERAALFQKDFMKMPAYEFTFINDSKGSSGCLENPYIATVFGKEIIYVENQSIVDIKHISSFAGENVFFNKIVETLKVE
jgi:hypothetical protein